MRLVFRDHNVYEVQWMWLPTFIGQNIMVMNELGEALRKKFAGQVGKEEDLLDEVHTFILDWLSARFRNISGLREYLEAVKNVQVAS